MIGSRSGRMALRRAHGPLSAAAIVAPPGIVSSLSMTCRMTAPIVGTVFIGFRATPGCAAAKSLKISSANPCPIDFTPRIRK